MATITNSICTNGTEIDIQSATGNINVGSASAANNIVIGNQTGSSSTTIYAGSGAMLLNPTASFTVTAGSDIFIDGGSDMHIGTTVSNHTIAFGTASGKHINIGSNSATLQMFSGPGGLFIQTSNGGAQFDASSGGIFLTTGLGTVSISDDAVVNTITIATGAAAKSLTLGSSNTTSTTTINAGSGGLNIPSFTTTGALVSTAAGLITDASASTTGFVLTSNGASTPPSFQAAGGGGGMTWTNTTGSTQAMAVSTGYINNGSGTPTVFTLPSTAAVGQNVAIIGANSGLWQIAQNSGQIIHFNGGATTSGTGGFILATSQYDTLFLMCVTANTTWVAYDGFGNYSIN